MRTWSLLVLAAVCLAGREARADEPRFEVAARGATLQADLGLSRGGYHLMSDLGGEAFGIRSYGRHWLFAWDVLGSARLGALANTEPYLFLFGARLAAMAEPVYRFLPGALSPTLSARLAGDAMVLWPVADPDRDLRTLNDMDELAGVVGHGRGRVAVGLSSLGDGKSLLVEGFGEESLTTHTQNADGEAFSGGGLAARFDWAWGLVAELEISGATTLALRDDALDRTTQTTRLAAAGSARKIFDNGMWLGLYSSIRRDTASVTWEATGTRFDVAPPADFVLGAAFGVQLWETKRRGGDP